MNDALTVNDALTIIHEFFNNARGNTYLNSFLECLYDSWLNGSQYIYWDPGCIENKDKVALLLSELYGTHFAIRPFSTGKHYEWEIRLGDLK